MLKKLSLANFKGFKRLNDLEIRPITVLVGKNSGGKSSIMNSVALLKQSLLSLDSDLPLDSFGPLVDLGIFKDFVHKKNYKNTLAIEVELNSSRHHPGGIYRFEFRGLQRTQRVEMTQQIYRSQDLEICIKNPDSDIPSVLINKKVNPDFYPYRNKNYIWDAFPRSGTASDNSDLVWRTLWDANRAYIRQANQIFYVGPLRAQPRRIYELTGHNPYYVGPSGENAVHILLSEYQRIVQQKNRAIISDTRRWLNYFGMTESLEVHKVGFGATLEFKQKGKEYSSFLPELGFGVSQIFPIIVQSIVAPNGSLCMLEQPEIHLHPSLQALLADMFVHYSNDKNFIIETHSEHFVRGLQLAVAKKQIPSENIAIYYIDCVNQETPYTKIEVLESGKLSQDWPIDFYNIGFNLSREILKHQNNIHHNDRMGKSE